MGARPSFDFFGGAAALQLLWASRHCQCTNDLKKQTNNEELKVDELERFDRRQNLVFEGVPQIQNEKVIEIIFPWQVKLMLI